LHRLKNGTQGIANPSRTEIEEEKVTKKVQKDAHFYFRVRKDIPNIKTVKKKKKDGVVW